MGGETPLPFPQWEGPAIGLLDLDAFFASVEQLDHPEWRGKPVIVGGDEESRGVVSTASYEARVYGVHSAMPAGQARRLCPQAIWTHGHYRRYRELSDRVMALLGAETPRVEQVSIDEAFVDVTPGRWSRESPIAICRRVQREVAALGVTCSIGLGTNKTVAKIASERDKPRGLTVVLPGTERAFLAPLPVATMSGIGGSTQRRLETMGIRTLGELSRADVQDMRRSFGVMGPRMVERAAGLERSVVAPQAQEDDAKSVSNERTFADDLTTRDQVEAAIMHVAALTGRRLRKKGLKGSTVTLKVRLSDFSTHTAQCRLEEPSDDEQRFGRVALALLPELWKPGDAVRLVGVGLSGFHTEAGMQARLFSDDGQPTHSEGAGRPSVSIVTDELRQRFGDSAVSFGRDLRFDESKKRRD